MMASLSILLLLLQTTSAARFWPALGTARVRSRDLTAIKPTFSGYVTVDEDGSAIYYAYYEAQARASNKVDTPIILWLQGGPGCASTFGGFYELGPWRVTPELGVEPNPGSWTTHAGLLLLDQPVGTGYSRAARGNASMPADEMGMAAHLYAALQGFFGGHSQLATRPFFITGESYAGKYVPSIAHYILQAAEGAEGAEGAQGAGAAAGVAQGGNSRGADAAAASAETVLAPRLAQLRALPRGIAPPAFRLAGVAVGNGLTDPRAQTQTLASAAYYAGLLPPGARDVVAGRAAQVVGLIDEGKWAEAHATREALRSYITNITGLATMFDTRRTEAYDPTKAVDRFLDLPEVKAALRADPGVRYASCSDAVRAAMGADVMRSVRHLLPDVLRHMPVLLYQGQYDILDGVASVTSWLSKLDWEGAPQLAADAGRLWRLRGGGGGEGDASPAAGWVRAAGPLTHAVVYRAGHMVPRDQPGAAAQMIGDWMAAALSWHAQQEAAAAEP